MLPFFRKIRWRLAANNQFFKYSRYAIGEIVLVVIGILIDSLPALRQVLSCTGFLIADIAVTIGIQPFCGIIREGIGIVTYTITISISHSKIS